MGTSEVVLLPSRSGSVLSGCGPLLGGPIGKRDAEFPSSISLIWKVAGTTQALILNKSRTKVGWVPDVSALERVKETSMISLSKVGVLIDW